MKLFNCGPKIELLVLHSNTWNHLTVYKWMNGVINKMFIDIIYLIYMYEQDLALNNPQWFICYKTKPNHEVWYAIKQKKTTKKTTKPKVWGNQWESDSLTMVCYDWYKCSSYNNNCYYFFTQQKKTLFFHPREATEQIEWNIALTISKM